MDIVVSIGLRIWSTIGGLRWKIREAGTKDLHFFLILMCLVGTQCGIGRFHWILLAACGMGLAGDSAELLVLGFVLPSAEVDFCISQTEKRVLGKHNFKLVQR